MTIIEAKKHSHSLFSQSLIHNWSHEYFELIWLQMTNEHTHHHCIEVNRMNQTGYNHSLVFSERINTNRKTVYILLVIVVLYIYKRCVSRLLMLLLFDYAIHFYFKWYTSHHQFNQMKANEKLEMPFLCIHFCWLLFYLMCLCSFWIVHVVVPNPFVLQFVLDFGFLWCFYGIFFHSRWSSSACQVTDRYICFY